MSNPTTVLCCVGVGVLTTLQVGSWEHLEQIPIVTVIFVQATFAQVTIVHIRNISAVTDPILMELKVASCENLE